jgi:hypothetical protein
MLGKKPTKMPWGSRNDHNHQRLNNHIGPKQLEEDTKEETAETEDDHTESHLIHTIVSLSFLAC